ncbi:MULTISPECIES: nucleoside diphosphate kinase regulator [Stenotrophomonas]|jgi:regulator of nucleoside diphosphate kinase|uniref:Regulator of nucleoside diphosphate kinase n=3 Tax=Gammaproteobacteria TaxID=1236 RepID=A0A498BU64_9GAMM|nr:MULTISPECIES: nucleoside diphosphate kinase regulator [Stenotrophomonas]MBU2051099.1 nucleoside diphosphate kinase regulator [Gammaproteobacteria bacterium]AOX62993.1 nucleoside diphosphate kinase regulator [Stenotrophomonas sp. LM091]MCX2919227.1 nucleoside diphosphate kinase regulator [Stenotrophomonas rhizophila]MDX5516244.1 nucleoside diphosphate kinase regulator [Stenotrophomonas sp. RG-453]NWF34262.1 nucleoside diphosphate kinase regulator [Stenotrophomonas sp. SAM-B]
MSTSSGLPPSIIVSSHDMDRLDAMLESPAVSQTPAGIALAEELNRATVVAPDQVPEGTVMMHSRVECEDELQNEKHVLTLVYPREADVEQGKVSILAPVGTALLGLSIGQTMDWVAPGGRKLRLRVTAVHHQPHA